MPKKRLKPFTLPGHRQASRLAARAEDLLKANDDVYGEIYDRLDALEREASVQQAGSKEAALFQLGILSRVGGRLAEGRQDSADALIEGQTDNEVMRLAATHTRLVQSLAWYIEAITGVNRHECGLAFYFGAGE